MGETFHKSMAQYAHEKVSGINKNRYRKEFRSLARSFPSLMQVNGLGAATAFLFSKNKSNAHVEMYNIIDGWTKEKFAVSSNDDLMKRIVNMESSTYRVYMNEIMDLSLWVKRFAEGMIESETQEGKRNGK